jgi:hypothetical protein
MTAVVADDRIDITSGSMTQLFSAAFFGVIFEAMAFPFYKTWLKQHETSLSFYPALKKVCANQHLYHEFPTLATGAFPAGAMYFWGRKKAEAFFGNDFFGCVMQALCAQSMASLVLEPTLLLVQQNCVSQKAQVSHFHAMRLILRQSGVRGVYRAALPGVMLGVVLDSLGYWFYQQIKKRYPESVQANVLSELSAYIMGFALAAAFVVPIDGIATRLRFSALTDPEISCRFPEKNMMAVARKIYQTGGVRQFWHGTRTNMLRSGTLIMMIPAAEIMGYKG